jgi:hypothetical protein
LHGFGADWHFSPNASVNGRCCHGGVSVQQNEICYMTFITYMAEMAAERSVDQCRLDLRDESIGRGEPESVTDT